MRASQPHIPRRRRRSRTGFTLIEAALVIVIVGFGVVASAELLTVGTRANGNAHRLTTGLNLAANIYEFAQNRPAPEIYAISGQTFSPPRDARNASIAGLEGWQQTVDVQKVDPSRVSTTVSTTSSSRLMRLAVTVRYQGQIITQESWLLADTSE